MNRINIITAFAALLLAVALAHTRSQASDGFDLTWHTIDGGGGISTGGGYSLTGTIGQPDAGAHTGGDYQLTGGFWHADDTSPVIPCPADLDGNGVVNVFDLFELLHCWGPVTPGCEAADLIITGTVNVFDLFELIINWGPCQ